MIEQAVQIIKLAAIFSQEIKSEFSVRLPEKPEVFKCDLAIMTSTAQEFEAVVSLLTDVKELNIENNDSLIYYKASNGKIKIILPYPVGMGIEAAVISATKTITHFSPDLIIMCGICAGNKNVTKIGDLVIAEKSINYSNVVEIEKAGTKRKKFMQSADSINKNLKARLELFVNGKELKTTLESISLPPNYQTPIGHVGLMVTGSSLLRSGEKMADINDSYHGIKGMDMETHGLYFEASNSNKDQAPLFVSMKAVSDFGDETNHKVSAEIRTNLALEVSIHAALQFSKEHFK
jgi:nucleoside phosphorylase